MTLTRLAVILLAGLITAVFVSGCATLPPAPPQPEILALRPATSGELADLYSNVTDRFGPDRSGFLLLARNDEALNWRLALADLATTSIDAQYFIWQNDEAGLLFFDRLLRAADRGVRVRLLVDDMLFAAKDRNIAVLCSHPNLEIKLFNPGRVRDSTLGFYGDFLLNFREMNRRMHNKLFAVDNRVAIIGGRNIGNEYFGLGKKYNFRDLDVLVAGPVMEDVSLAFDEYWNADDAYPGAAISAEVTKEEFRQFRKGFDKYLKKSGDLLASYPMQPGKWTREIELLPSRMKPGEAHFIQDHPVTFDGAEHRLSDMLMYLAEPSHKELIMATPYLIPVKGFLDDLAKLSSEGVKVKIVTGSMGSNNHTVAHSHYKKYRRRILKTGAALYEFRHDPPPATRAVSDVPPVRAKFISLHNKAIVGDRQRCFIGSLNLDPRAIEINTENGLYIQSPELCGELAD